MATITASPLIRLHASDNVLIARQPIALGQDVPEFGLRVRAQVPAGHKIAARAIAEGEPVRKYDTVIGFAVRRVEAGEHVHTHNLRFEEFDREPEFCADVQAGRPAAARAASHLHGHRAAATAASRPATTSASSRR
jgi:altronate hydrolase